MDNANVNKNIAQHRKIQFFKYICERGNSIKPFPGGPHVKDVNIPVDVDINRVFWHPKTIVLCIRL